MKRLLIAITFLVLFGIMGFTHITAQSETKQAYNIDKIVIGVDKSTPIELIDYELYSIGLIKEFAKEHNITVEEIKYDSLDDITTALQRGDIDVTIGITSVNAKYPELVKTYSYHTGALYAYSGKYEPLKLIVDKDSYSFAVNKKNEELTQFLNEKIEKYKNDRKMKEVRERYLRDRAKL
jgi:hypothetical protein